MAIRARELGGVDAVEVFLDSLEEGGLERAGLFDRVAAPTPAAAAGAVLQGGHRED